MATTVIGGSTTIPVRDASLRGLSGRKHQEWFMDEIYLGDQTKEELHHTSVGDIVKEILGGNIIRFYRVVAIDDVTRIPTLSPLRQYEEEDTAENKLELVGPGLDTEVWRVFYDDTVEPFTLRIDSNMFFRGSLVTNYKIFLGTNISSANGRVISQYRDANTDTVSVEVPVQLAGFRDNTAIKVPVTCHTTEVLQDGEVVTVVSYGADGDVYSVNKMKICKTADVRRVEESMKMVTSIELDTPFLSTTEDKQIEFPINMDKEALFMRCVVTYEDGSTRTLPIDGGRVQLHGYDSYVPSVRGQEYDLVLVYHLPNNELSKQAQRGEGRFVTQTYTARTREVDGAYSVKLFAIPRFLGQEWELRFWLYNLDRDISYDVTEYIEASTTREPFNPRKYGVTQLVGVSLELQSVNPSFARYRHTQDIEVTLMGTPTIESTPFFLNYRPGQDSLFGENVKAVFTVNAKNKKVGSINLTCGETTQDSWLNRLYYAVEPMYNKYTELKAPKPTHFAVITELGTRTEVAIADWNKGVSISADEINTVVRIEWLHKSDESIQYMGSTPMLVKSA